MEEQPVALPITILSPKSWGEQLHIRRLAAAGARAGELKQRAQELAALDGILVDGECAVRKLGGVFPVGFLLGLRFRRLERERLGAALARADVGAVSAAVQSSGLIWMRNVWPANSCRWRGWWQTFPVRRPSAPA